MGVWMDSDMNLLVFNIYIYMCVCVTMFIILIYYIFIYLFFRLFNYLFNYLQRKVYILKWCIKIMYIVFVMKK
jgi:hypothetical protein